MLRPQFETNHHEQYETRAKRHESLFAHIPIQQIFDRLTANHHMRVLLGYGNNRRNQRLIVVAGHRTTVCTRNRHRQHVTALNIGRKTHLVDDDIARFAVHADHTAQLGFAGTLTIGDFRSVIRSVQCRANIVAHTAVDRHVHAFRNRIASLVFRGSSKLHRLDRSGRARS